MDKKEYRKPAMKDFSVGYVRAGLCYLGISARGDCSQGQEVVDPGPSFDCGPGDFVIRYCSVGTGVTECYTGTFA